MPTKKQDILACPFTDLLYLPHSTTVDYLKHLFFNFIFIFLLQKKKYVTMHNTTIAMAPSPQHNGVLRIPGFLPASADVRVDTPSSSIGSTLDPNVSNTPPSLTIHFSNICDLCSNLSSVEHHLASTLPNLIL